MNDKIPTPRTDAYVRESFAFGPPAHADFARQLERELAVAMDALRMIADQDDELTAHGAIDRIEAMRREFEEGK